MYINDITANLPTGGLYVGRSPYSLKPEEGGLRGLEENGRRLCTIEAEQEPGCYRRETAGGVPYWKVSVRHGRGASGPSWCRTASTARRRACSAQSRRAGRVKRRPPSRAPRRSPKSQGRPKRKASHIVLTTGKTDIKDKGIPHIARCAAAVKGSTGMKVHVQFEPPRDLGLVEEIGSISDSAAINVETMDSLVLRRVAPGKAATSFARYRATWERAVDVFRWG